MLTKYCNKCTSPDFVKTEVSICWRELLRSFFHILDREFICSQKLELKHFQGQNVAQLEISLFVELSCRRSFVLHSFQIFSSPNSRVFISYLSNLFWSNFTMIVSLPQKKLTTNFLSLSSLLSLMSFASNLSMNWSFENTFLTSFLGGLGMRLKTLPRLSSSSPYPL